MDGTDAQTNDAERNEVVAFRRADDRRLSRGAERGRALPLRARRRRRKVFASAVRDERPLDPVGDVDGLPATVAGLAAVCVEGVMAVYTSIAREVMAVYTAITLARQDTSMYENAPND